MKIINIKDLDKCSDCKTIECLEQLLKDCHNLSKIKRLPRKGEQLEFDYEIEYKTKNQNKSIN